MNVRVIAGRWGNGARRGVPAFAVLFLLLFLLALLALGWRRVYGNYFLKAAYPCKYSAIVETCSAREKLDPHLVYAVIRTESNFNAGAHSNKDARGLMQLTPATFEWAMGKAAEKEAYTSADLYRPEVNIRYGTQVLAAFLADFGDERTALAAYNAGPSNVKKWLADKRYSSDGKTLSAIPFAETRGYVEKVEEGKKMYAALYADTGAQSVSS